MSPQVPSPTEFLTQQLIRKAAQKYDVDPSLVAKVAQTESSMDPTAQSSAGAQGIMQLMPATQKQFGVTDPFDPEQNIPAGTHDLSDLIKKYGDKRTALAAYNWGPDNVDAAMAKYGKNWLNHAPKETRDYVNKIAGADPSASNVPSPAQFLEQHPSAPKTKAPLTVGSAWNWLWTPIGETTPDKQAQRAGWWNWATTPVIFTDKQRQQAEGNLVNLASRMGPLTKPVAELGEYGIHVAWRTADLAKSVTSPGMMALTAMTLGEDLVGEAMPKGVGAALKATRLGTGAAFTAQAAGQALTGKQPGETDLQATRRRLMAGGMALLAGTGTADDMADAAKKVIRNRFGLTGDLADRVSDRAAKILKARLLMGDLANKSAEPIVDIKDARESKIRAIEDAHNQAIHSATATFEKYIADSEKAFNDGVATIEQTAKESLAIASQQLDDLQQAHMNAGAKILAATVQAADQEHARVQAPFDELGEKLPEKVESSNDVRGIIDSSLDEAGVQPGERPAAAYKALPPAPSETPVQQTASLTRAGLLTQRLIKEGLPADQIRGTLLNLQYTPRQVDSLMGQAGLAASGAHDMSFSDLTRVKNDLWDAAESAKDPIVAKGLRAAHEKIVDLQQKIADDAGRGPEYKKAKTDYMKFKRSIGSSLIEKWTSARDQEQQTMAPKVAKLMTKQVGEALRGILKSAGIDVSSLDAIVQLQEETEKRTAEIPKEQERATRELTRETEKGRSAAEKERQRATKAAEAEKEAAIKEARKDSAQKIKGVRESQRALSKQAAKEIAEIEREGATIVPGKTISDLSGMTENDIQAQRIRALMDKVKISGMSRMFSLIIALYGAARVAMGSSFGAFELGYGGVRLMMPEIMQSAAFQDMIIRLAEVDPENEKMTGAVKTGLNKFGKQLKDVVKTQIPAAAAAGTIRARAGLTPPPSSSFPVQDYE